MSTSTELLVVGGGPGGYVAAIRAAQRGLTVTLVERGDLGGVCLNEGCVPSKALIHGAAELVGARAAGSMIAANDWLSRLHDHTSSVVGRLRNGIGSLLQANGVDLVRGTATLTGPTTAAVTSDDLAEPVEIGFAQAVLATGSAAVELPHLPFDGTRVLSAREVLDLAEVPNDVVIVGGGYIGLELAGVLHDLGAEVHVVEMLDRLLPGIDPVLASALERSLRTSGYDIRLGHKVVADTGTAVEVEGPDGAAEIPADLVVVAIGRRPLTAELGLAAAGLDVAGGGLLEVDAARRTSVSNIFAIGDIVPGPALAHKAMAEALVAADVAAGHTAAFDPAAIPAVVYTTPEIATVGLTAADATERGIATEQVRFPLAANARSLTLGGGKGFGVLVFEPDSRLVLGLHLLGPGVGELIGIGTLAIEMGAVVDDLAHTIFPHPSVSEVVGELGELALGLPVHSTPPKRR